MKVMGCADVKRIDPRVGGGVLIRSESPETAKLIRIGFGPAVVPAGEVEVDAVAGVRQ